MNSCGLSLNTVGSGSYAAGDVSLLLRLFEMESTAPGEKERLIQTGARHYSEMISHENAPTETHMAFYRLAFEQNSLRLARDVKALALYLHGYFAGRPIVLVSFVRAGLPLGVLLLRALGDMGHASKHYGVSIVRDRGIDRVALDAIILAHGAENVVFVDGWTGKGAISDELRRSLSSDERFPGDPRLVVLADPCGKAWLSASSEDWIIPSGVLGATVSGLVSRSIFPSDAGLHGCVMYKNLQSYDVTRNFVDDVAAMVRRVGDLAPAEPLGQERAITLQGVASRVIEKLAGCFNVANFNRVKPGIAEATRAVLRRVPERVLVRSFDDSDVQLLLHLTGRARIDVAEAGAQLGPYRAVTIIRGMDQ